MRELLKEAAEVLRRGQADEQAILAKHIDDVLAKPEQDAMELVQQVRQHSLYWTPRSFFIITDSKAAALIADYGKRVPRAMLREIYAAGWDDGKDDNSITSLETIAAKYDVEVEG